MSTLKVNTIQDTTGNNALTIDSSGNVTASQGFIPSTQLSHRNLIINGAMNVAQRGTSWTNQAGTRYNLDRWTNQENGSAVFSISQENSNAPDGFKYFHRVTVTTADASTDSGDFTCVKQVIETGNLHHLDWGTSNAKAITLSFWVRSSSAGTFTVAFYHQGTTSYSYAAAYTINTADTWEYKTITIPGNTTQAHDNSDTDAGLQIRFALSAGSTRAQSTGSWATGNYFAGTGQTQLTETVNSTFDLTGVQLEVGSVATPFEHRSYGEELARCQRYYQQFGIDGDAQVLPFSGQCTSSSTVYFMGQTYVPMRTQPSGSSINPSNFRVRNAGNSGIPSISSLNVSAYSETSFVAVAEGASGLTAGHSSALFNYNGSNYGWIELDAEL